MRKVLFTILVALGAAFPGKVLAEQVVLSTAVYSASMSIPEETVDRVLEQAAPHFNRSYTEMKALYEAGDVTIEQVDTHTYKVTLDDGSLTQILVDDTW